ncbi:MAG TPA: GNAT family N-acetyltransferase [Acidimicrobiales bacterium]|nr:GNAT family N-acetyltransferase [Acidimicrobiales bacterium]
MTSVRLARTVDRGPVVATVAAAFARDPAWSFLCGDDYDRLAPQFAGALFDTRVGSGHVWVSDDLASVAMWDPPGKTPSSQSERLWQAYRAVAGEAAWRRLSEYEGAIDKVRPSTTYWYLGVLATHPDRHGQGLASSVIAPIFGRADSDGLACCLETSTARNRQFYGRRGFSEVTDIHVASGPPTWWLRRPPQPSS